MIYITEISPGNSIASCSYLVVSDGHAILIDPSVSLATLENALRSRSLPITLDAVLITHGHFDHVFGLNEIKQAYPNALVYIHKSDEEMLSDANKNAFRYFYRADKTFGKADILLEGGEIIAFADGDLSFEVIHTPGHSRGSVCYFLRSENALFCGDLIFSEGVGRHDLYGGNLSTLVSSLDFLKQFNKDNKNITIYPGHGDSSPLSDALEYLLF